MAKHPSNAIHGMQFMFDEKNFHSWHGAQAAWNRQLNALFLYLVLFGAQILSFFEWKIVQQLLGDNSGVTCVSIGKSTRNI